MSRVPAIDDLDVAGRRVILRADLNVPLEGGEVRDATRIERVVPTIRELVDRGAAVIVLSHFGRPNGRVVPEMSLEPVAAALARALGGKVEFVATDWRDGAARAAAAAAQPGDVLLMENTRFHPGEEANDAAFASTLSELGDVYVNDAFSAAHRAHASTEAIARRLPAAAGRAMQAELAALSRVLETPQRPVAAVVGGAKISTKLDLLANLTAKVDTIVIGGGMANTFLAAQGRPVGRSLCEHNLLETARQTLQAAERAGCRLLLPVDVVVAGELAENAPSRTVGVDEVQADEMILDVGEATVGQIVEVFEAARTLVWNGPLGAFETRPFDAGTVAAARAAARLTRDGSLVSVAGGGDTVAALAAAGVIDDFTYVSTAGGAFLEWLEGKALPGVEVLKMRASGSSA